jgi:hypothetical protein
MEAVNEGCKLVAQAKESILKYLQEINIEESGHLHDARILLDMALEKLAV